MYVHTSLYGTLKANEDQYGRRQVTRSELLEVFEKVPEKEDLRWQSERATHLLGRVHDEILDRSVFQLYSLEKHVEAQPWEDLQKTLQTVGLDPYFPHETHGSDRFGPHQVTETSIDALRRGILRHRKGTVRVIPNLGNRLKNSFYVCAGFSGFAGIQSFFTSNLSLQEALSFAGYASAIPAVFAIPANLISEENPHLRIANELEYRTEYIIEQCTNSPGISSERT